MKKRFLSILLTVCMAVTLLPTAAFAAQTTTVNNYDELRTAVNAASDGDTIAIGADITISASIKIEKKITLDLGSYTLTYAPQSASVCLYFAAGGAISGTDTGSITNTVPGSLLVNNAGGTLEITGGTLSASGAQSRAVQNNGTLEMTGGAVESVASYAILNTGVVNVSGGTVTTETGVGVLNYSANARLTLSGGTVSTTSETVAQTYAAYNNAAGAEIAVDSDATVTAGSGNALGNLNGGKITVNGGDISATSGAAILNDGDSTTAIHGGRLSSASGSALMNYGNLLVDGGSVSAGSALALRNLAKGGTSVTLSGGSLTSDAYTAINNQSTGDILLSGTTVSGGGTSPAVVNFSTGTVRVEQGPITAVGSYPTFYNVSTGSFVITGGTYYGIYNANDQGKIVIDGGSIYTYTGIAPKNSAGDSLQNYTIQLTNAGANTSVSSDDLTFTPTVKYGFTDVHTDASRKLYLWLPAGTSSATYQTDTGSITGGSESALPNANFTVSVYLDNELWTTCPAAFRPMLRPASGGTSTYAGPSDTGVFSYPGMDANTTYNIFGKAALGQAAFEGVTIGKNADVNGSTSSVRVDYYTLKTVKGSGVSFLYPSGEMQAMKNATITLSCTPEDGKTFEKWVDATGNTVSTKADFQTTITAPQTYTATAKIQPYTATVTVKKDNDTWTDCDKAIVLSPSSTSASADGYQSVVPTQGVSSFSDLKQTFYVWADGVYTGQTITSGSPAAAVDYYTVTLTKSGSAGMTLTGSGTYLKGSNVTINATIISDSDYVFSRWTQTQGGALYATTAEKTISGINAPVSLTAVAASTKYTATVTVNKDGAVWTTDTRSVKLSTSQTALTEEKTAATASGVYTFAGLDGSKTYYVWDTVTNAYTGTFVSAGDAANQTLNYYSVNVTNQDSTLITAVTGSGVYLKGSDVTLTATPATYYRVKWGDNTTGTVKRITNLAAKADITVTGELETYTGTVTLKLDSGNPYQKQTVTLKPDTGDAVPTTEATGVYTTAENALDPTKTYKVLVGGTNTGATLTAANQSATVQYYTVTVNVENVAAIEQKIVQSGRDTTAMTATPNTGFDFMGWYDSVGKLLTTITSFTVTNVTAATTLTAKASDKFDAVITVTGATATHIITLQSGSEQAVSAESGTTTFKNLDRGKTYKVLDGTTDTGKTVSKNAPNATLQYYTVTLTHDSSISDVTGAGDYLAGSSATIDATVNEGSIFGSWAEEGGALLSTQKSYTIPAIGRNYSLTAKTALSFSGTVDITSGSIVIEDDTATGHEGKIRITVGGAVPQNGDNLSPGTNITITGGTTDTPAANTITVTTSHDVTVTLKNVHISSSTASPMSMTGAGTLTLDWAGTNTLTSTAANSAGLHKGANGKLILQGSDNSATLAATGGQRGAGIGGNSGEVASSITINSGTVIAVGGYAAAGIGSGNGKTAIGIVINGGTITSTAGYKGCGIGAGACSDTNGYAGNVTINGGTMIANGGGDLGTGIGVQGNGTVIINGGTMSSGSDRPVIGCNFGTATVKINGGNIIGNVQPSTDGPYDKFPAKNAKGETVYKTTFSTKKTEVTNVSKALTIRDKNGTAYGMNDVKTDADGKVYAYLAADTAGAVYDSADYGALVDKNGTGVFQKIVEAAHTVTVPTPATVEGGTATGSLQQVLPQYVNGATVTVNVALSGTAAKRGTYTVGLSSSAVTITAPTPVTQYLDVNGTPASTVYTFTFPMPNEDVSDLAVTLRFTEDAKHTVTYSAPDATGGSVPATARYYEGQTYTVDTAAKLTRAGYTFAGWGATGTKTMGKADVTYTAQWTPNAYAVTFNANDGTSNTSTQSFTYGETKALTANAFTRAGYAFAGWATSPAGTKAYTDKDAITVTENTTLYALWNKESYTVTFNGNGGSGSMTAQTVPNNAPAALTGNAFTKTGYTFAGWNTQADGKGTAYADGASITTGKDVTLTAQWTANAYKVQFNANGGSGSMDDQSFTYDAPAAELKDNTFSKTGYVFGGWNTQADGKGTAYANKQSVQNLTADVTLYAQWTAATHTVTFNGNGSTSGDMTAQSFTYDEPEKPLTTNAFAKTGYVFGGWNTKTDGTGTAYADKQSLKNLTANLTLYAQWGAASFTVKFDKNGGSGAMSDQMFQTGDTAALKSSTFSKTGSTFTGWNTKADGTGTSYDADAAVNTLNMGESDSITLYAQWTANAYKVQFNANGGSGTMDNQSFTYGAGAAALTANTFEKTGYTFLGWAESPAAASAEYADGQPVQNLTPMSGGVVSLYAVWKADTVSVVFDGNGADSGSMEKQSFAYNTAQALSQNTYQRTGYTFAGWNTQANGRGVSYADQQSITNPAPDISGSLTLYAQWQEQSRYGLSGLVQTDGTPAAPIQGATITLKQGDKVLGVTKTDANGNYSFTNLLPGSYNVVCTYDGKTVTKAAAVADKAVSVPFTVSSTAKNSLLELRTESGVSVPALVVDGLSDVANAQPEAQATTVKLTVTAKAPDKENEEQTAIQAAAKDQTIGMYLDAQLTSNGASIGSSNDTVLKILIPYDFSAKTGLKVLRYHGSAATELTQLQALPETSPADGTWYPDTAGGQIIVYAAKFSTYAISYTPVSNTGNTGSSGGGSSVFPIVIGSSEHGKLTANQTTAAAGTEVTVTAKPDNGYGLHHLIVTDADGKAILYTDKGNGTYTFTMPKSKTTVSAKFVQRSENLFIDVAENAYYYDAVLWAASKGVTSGTSATTFTPDGICTRAQTVTFLWRAMGSPEPTSNTCPFTDVKADAYYYKAVLWATEQSITKGTSATAFSPDMTVTRSQTVTLLHRAAGTPAAGAANPFTDVKTGAYYADAVLWAVQEAITQGTSASTFSPMDGCTRSQIVTFLYRYLSK